MKKLLLVLALTSACKKSDDSKKTDEAAKPTTVETSKTEATKTESPVAPPKSEPPKAEPAAAPVNAAKLAAGETKQGCFAWSETKKSVACIVGEQGPTGAELALAYVGTDQRTALTETVDQATADKENAVLARDGYVAFTDKAVEVPQKKKTAAGGSLSLTWSLTQTSKGGENIAPSHKGKVVASCNGKDTTIYEQQEDEGRTFTVSLRQLATHTLVEITTNLGREGEFSDGTLAFLVDTASCAVTKAE